MCQNCLHFLYVDIMLFCSYLGTLLVKNCPSDTETNPTTFTFAICIIHIHNTSHYASLFYLALMSNVAYLQI